MPLFSLKCIPLYEPTTQLLQAHTCIMSGYLIDVKVSGNIALFEVII